VSNPGSFEDVVELLVPELRRRGIFWEDYDVTGGTFRENMLGQTYLRDDHYGSKFKYGKEPIPTAASDATNSALETVSPAAAPLTTTTTTPLPAVSLPIEIK
jgi:hypothetical protein